MKKWIPHILLILSAGCYTVGGPLIIWPALWGLEQMTPTLMDQIEGWFPGVLFVIASVFSLWISIRWRNTRWFHFLIGFLSCAHVIFFLLLTNYYSHKHSVSEPNWGAGDHYGLSAIASFFLMFWAIVLALGPAFGMLRLWLLSKWGNEQDSMQETL